MNAVIPPDTTRQRTLIFCAGIFFAAALAISGQSLWIDEACTAVKAQQETLPGWWHEMRHIGGSDLQMPLYMLWIWACEKLFGSGEIALRAVNLFWLLPGLLAWWRVLARQPQLQQAFFLVAACNPFVWYYLDEARPYAMQIGASLFLTAALCRWSEQTASPPPGESFWAWGFAGSLVALSGASMLGMVWAGAAIVAAIFLTPRERLLKLGRDHVLAWLAGITLLAALGVYYLWTLKAGARASDVASTNAKNVVFIAYELLGFAGLGPGRLEIREGGLQVFKPYGPELGLYGAVVLTLIVYAVRDGWRHYSHKKILGLAVIAAAPAAFIVAAGVVLHFRVLGRHAAPLIPCLLFLTALGWQSLAERGGWRRILAVTFLGLSLVSALSLRFCERHAKDDYRRAAGIAQEAKSHGERVWWCADGTAGGYYGVPLTNSPAAAPGRVWLVGAPTEALLMGIPPPDLLLLSKPDIYDANGHVRAFLVKGRYKLAGTIPAFTIWQRP